MLPLLLGVGLLTAVRPAGADVAAALPAVALAAALRFLFGYTVALAAFWTPRVGALNAAAAQLIFLLGGEAAPVPLLPDALRPWAVVLPFRALLGFPAELAAGLLTGPEARAGYALQLVWLAVFGGLAGWVWRAGVRRYTAVGG
jgi:ABC-2 type transport system permease protein